MLAYVRALDNPAADGGSGAFWAGLAGWARPETFVAAAHPVARRGCSSGARDADPRGSCPAGGARWRCSALLIAGFVAFNVWIGGRPLPNTFYAKNYGMGAAVSLAEGGRSMRSSTSARYPAEPAGRRHPVAGLARWLAVWRRAAGRARAWPALGAAGAARWTALLAVLVFTPIAKGLVAPQPVMLVHDGRYVLHLLVLGLVVCACGVAVLARVRAAALGGGACWRWPGWSRSAARQSSAMDTYAAEVKNINDLQVRTGHWIAEHTSPDARVATNDIGAIAFFSRRFILDTEGLVTPDAIWDKRMWRIDRFFERAQPDVVVIFPHWYPYLAQRPSGLIEVARLSAKKVIAGGETLVVYRTPWTRPGRLRAGTYSNK